MQRTRFLQELQIFSAAFILAITGISVLEVFPVIAVIITCTGIATVLSLAIAKHRKWPLGGLKAVLLLLESLALFLTAYLSHSLGKRYLPYVIALAALGFLVSAVVKWRSNVSVDPTPPGQRSESTF